MEWKKLTFDEIRCTSIGDPSTCAVYTKPLSALSSANEIIFPSITPAYCSGGAYMIRYGDSTQQSVITSGQLSTLRQWYPSNNTLGICCLNNPWGYKECHVHYLMYIIKLYDLKIIVVKLNKKHFFNLGIVKE